MENLKAVEEQFDQEELTHSDKLVGVLSSPVSTFQKIINDPIKNSDWVIPVITLIILSVISLFIVLSKPAIKQQMLEKQMATIEQRLDAAVSSGQITQDQADQQLNMIRDRLADQSSSGLIIQSVAMVVVFFVWFFIISAFFFVISKFVLKGEGSYKNAMVAYGLPYYILIVQVIVVLITSLLMNKLLTGFNVASLLDMEKTNFLGFLLSKVDPFIIWFYSTIAIGYAKLFNSDNTIKYIVTFLSVWISFSIIFFFLGQQFPFLQSFIR